MYPNYYQPYGGYMQPYIPQQRQDMSNMIQAQHTQQPQNTGFVCHPVSSREEAMAVQADFFSPGTLMPDLAHGMIYLKRFDQQTGTSTLFDFAVTQPQQNAETPPPAIPDYTETFQMFGEQLLSLQDRLDELMDIIDPPKRKGAAKE